MSWNTGRSTRGSHNTTQCRNGLQCTRVNCRFEHPRGYTKMCRFGVECRRRHECVFRHSASDSEPAESPAKVRVSEGKLNTAWRENRVASLPYGNTLLHQAIEEKNAAKVSELISEGADVNALNDAGWSPLRTAVTTLSETVKDTEIITSLLAAEADQKLEDRKANKVPLHEAVRLGKVSFVLLLTANSTIAVNLATSTGLSAIHYAVQAETNQVAILTNLLANSAVDNLTHEGSNALHFLAGTCESHPYELTEVESKLWELLVASGSDPLHVDTHGHTAIGRLFSKEMTYWKASLKTHNLAIGRNSPRTALVKALQVVLNSPLDTAEAQMTQIDSTPKTELPQALVAFQDFIQGLPQVDLEGQKEKQKAKERVNIYNMLDLGEGEAAESSEDEEEEKEPEQEPPKPEPVQAIATSPPTAALSKAEKRKLAKQKRKAADKASKAAAAAAEASSIAGLF